MGVLLERDGDIVRWRARQHRHRVRARCWCGCRRERYGCPPPGRESERRCWDHIGGLAADAGQGHQRGARLRHLAAVFLDQDAGQGDDVLGLLPEQADGLDRLGQRLDAQIQHLLRVVTRSNSGAVALVHPRHRSPCRQRHRDQQLGKGVDVMQLGHRMRVRRAKARKIAICAAWGSGGRGMWMHRPCAPDAPDTPHMQSAACGISAQA